MKPGLGLALALLLPGCAGQGAEGVPVPPPMDMESLQRSAAPHDALAAPAGFPATADFVTPAFHVPPARLYAALRDVAAAQPRTFQQVAYDDRMQIHYVVRSAVLNFPDQVAAQVNPDGTLILWSRSLYGHYDFGVNRRRLQGWLDALNARLGPDPATPQTH